MKKGRSRIDQTIQRKVEKLDKRLKMKEEKLKQSNKRNWKILKDLTSQISIKQNLLERKLASENDKNILTTND